MNLFAQAFFIVDLLELNMFPRVFSERTEIKALFSFKQRCLTSIKAINWSFLNDVDRQRQHIIVLYILFIDAEKRTTNKRGSLERKMNPRHGLIVFWLYQKLFAYVKYINHFVQLKCKPFRVYKTSGWNIFPPYIL